MRSRSPWGRCKQAGVCAAQSDADSMETRGLRGSIGRSCRGAARGSCHRRSRHRPGRCRDLGVPRVPWHIPNGGGQALRCGEQIRKACRFGEGWPGDLRAIQLLLNWRRQSPASRVRIAGTGGSGPGAGAAAEEINTKEVAQRITAELKRYSIPQAIFAQRILCRSQGTLSDLLRNPKPWSKLKSGRETFRRMWKWLQEPEFQRMSALRLAACKRKEQDQQKDRALQPKKQRLVFTDLQRRTLIAIFKENKRPSKEMQATISQQLGLELNTVSNFFMNARRRCMNRWAEEPGATPGTATATATFSKA
uniref:one cut domain family member 3 n=1 Tax=Myodes glareolus TaxID=447135 RepID=UPI00201FE09F|nr:one cut domain family member 3 [Myodes glareolus]